MKQEAADGGDAEDEEVCEEVPADYDEEGEEDDDDDEDEAPVRESPRR